jgi:hypothetical protein
MFRVEFTCQVKNSIVADKIKDRIDGRGEEKQSTTKISNRD